MSTTRLQQLLPQLRTQRPVTVVGAAVIDVIADAYALPWRGCDIELKQQGVNVGGCALNIAVALKRLGIDASNALPLGQGVWADIIRNRMAKEGLHSLIDNAAGDNGWCLALVEPDGERTFMSFSGVENQWNADWLAQLEIPRHSLVYLSGYQRHSRALTGKNYGLPSTGIAQSAGGGNCRRAVCIKPGYRRFWRTMGATFCHTGGGTPR